MSTESELLNMLDQYSAFLSKAHRNIDQLSIELADARRNYMQLCADYRALEARMDNPAKVTSEHLTNCPSGIPLRALTASQPKLGWQR